MHGDRRWLHPLLHGAAACRVFMPLCSPRYGDLDVSPWGAAELLHAAAAAARGGGPLILPVWHSGAEFPPNDDTWALLQQVPPAAITPAVPDARLYGYGADALGMGAGAGAAFASARGARAMPLHDVFTVVLSALNGTLQALDAAEGQQGAGAAAAAPAGAEEAAGDDDE